MSYLNLIAKLTPLLVPWLLDLKWHFISYLRLWQLEYACGQLQFTFCNLLGCAFKPNMNKLTAAAGKTTDERPGLRWKPHNKLTRAQSKSTASRMSSWCPMRETPRSSSSAWLILSSLSPHTPPRSNTHTYCCKQSSRPTGNAHIRMVTHNKYTQISSKMCSNKLFSSSEGLRIKRDVY